MSAPVFAIGPVLSFFFGNSLRAIVFRTLGLLGLGVVTYKGVSTLAEEVTVLINQQLKLLPPEYLETVFVLQFHTFMSLVISAIGIRLGITAARSFIGRRR